MDSWEGCGLFQLSGTYIVEKGVACWGKRRMTFTNIEAHTNFTAYTVSQGASIITSHFQQAFQSPMHTTSQEPVSRHFVMAAKYKVVCG